MQKDFYHPYEVEVLEMEHTKKSMRPSFWMVMLQATGIFVTITMIVFFVANYQFIKSQLVSWKKEDGYKDNFIDDMDQDGMLDWWEKQYGLDPAQKEDALRDTDNDGANNLTEYRYSTNPGEPDSDGDGYFDGEEIRKGYNPNGVGRIDTDKDGIYDWWEEQNGMDKNNDKDATVDFDNDGLSNLEEFTYQTDPNNPDSDSDWKPDGEEVQKNINPMGNGEIVLRTQEEISQDEDGDGLELFYETLYGTDPRTTDTDGDGFDDFHEASRGYNPVGEGKIATQIEIPKLGVNAPIVWSQTEDESQVQSELETGVLHYSGTAFPGMRGNSYITGHSSYYAWSKSQYKEIFKSLNNLEKGDVVIFHMSFANGKKLDVVYKMRSSEVVKPDDKRLFADYEGYEMTLVTCWPIGTDWKRLMVKADLQSPLPD